MEINNIKIATPISNLIVNKLNPEIISFSDCLETRDASINCDYSKQELFHCELQPIHVFNDLQINYLKEIKLTKPDLKLISFHLASCYENPKVIIGKFFPNGKKISEKKLIDNAKKNFVIIKKLFGEKIRIAVENNNHFNTEAYDFITKPDFIFKIVKDNKINFLLDIAHAKISAYNLKINFSNYLNKLPLNELIQIHIAKPGFDDSNEIYDKHDLPNEKDLTEVIALTKKYPTVEYLTVEYYKNADNLLQILKQLKIMIKKSHG